MVKKISEFSQTKTIIEHQILNTLDYLYTDDQIDEIEVVKVSRYVLSKIDTTTTIQDLFKNIRHFVNQHPLFKENIQKTIIALNKPYVA